MASIPPDCDLEPPKKRFRLCKVSFFSPYKLLALHTGTPLHFTQQQMSTKIAQSFTCTVDGCNRSYTCADTLSASSVAQGHNLARRYTGHFQLSRAHVSQFARRV